MAWRFDETNDNVQIDDHAALTLPDGDWAITGWIKWPDHAGAGFQWHFSWGAHSAAPSLSWLMAEADGKVSFLLEDADADGAAAITTGTPGTSTAWQHLILQRSGNTFTQYINGVADGALTNANVGVINVADNLFFGQLSSGGGRLGGDLAEWAKWDRALDATERAHLKDGVCPGSISGLVWWVQMLAGVYEEIIVPLTVTNDGSTPAAHPPIGYVPKHVINAHRRAA